KRTSSRRRSTSLSRSNIVLSRAKSSFGMPRSFSFPSLTQSPLPIPNLRQVLAALSDVLLVLDEFVADGLLGVGGLGTELRHAIDDVSDEMKAVEVIHHHHVEWSRGRAF